MNEAVGFTREGVQLHVGVVDIMGWSFRMRRRLIHRSQSRRRHVGNLQGQRGLQGTQESTVMYTHNECKHT